MTNSSDFLYSPKWTLHHPLTFVFKHLVSYIPFYQIKLKAQSLKIVEPESGLHVCVTVFFFNKGITFFFLLLNLALLVCYAYLMLIKYMHTFSVWV